MNPLQQCIDVAQGVMDNVTPDHMDNATPCASWNVGQLIDHMVDAHAFFATSVTGDAFEGGTKWCEGDYASAYAEHGSQCVNAFSRDGIMDETLDLPFGQLPGKVWYGMAMNDTFQHAWDLAKATGQSTDLAPELAEAILAQTRIPDSYRGEEGAPFGLATEAPEGACAADRLAALLGRQV